MEAHEAPITPDDATPAPAEQEPSQNGHGGPQPQTAVAEMPQVKGMDALFHYSAWVHVGPGADECEDREDGNCGDPHHFHAWCRLPNKFQQGAIRERALAARARTIRILKDPESDKRAILDSEMDTLQGLGKDILVDEVLSKSYWKDHLDAMRELAEGVDLDDDEENPWQHIEEDQRRYEVLHNMDAEERPQEEYDHLIDHLGKWNEAVDAKREEKQRPVKETLVEKSEAELIEMILADKIDNEAENAAQRAYSMYEWCVGTLKPTKRSEGTYPTVRMWNKVEDMQAAAPEVITAIEQAFGNLESSFGAAQQRALRAEGN